MLPSKDTESPTHRTKKQKRGKDVILPPTKQIRGGGKPTSKEEPITATQSRYYYIIISIINHYYQKIPYYTHCSSILISISKNNEY